METKTSNTSSFNQQKSVLINKNNEQIPDYDSTGDTGAINGIVSTHKLRKYIVDNILQPVYISDIKTILTGRHKCRRYGTYLFIASLIFTHIATIITFISAYDCSNSSVISLVAGTIGVLGNIFVHLSLMAKSESKKLTGQANKILHELNIDGVADLDTKANPEINSDMVIAIDKNIPDNESQNDSKSLAG